MFVFLKEKWKFWVLFDHFQPKYKNKKLLFRTEKEGMKENMKIDHGR